MGIRVKKAGLDIVSGPAFFFAFWLGASVLDKLTENPGVETVVAVHETRLKHLEERIEELIDLRKIVDDLKLGMLERFGQLELKISERFGTIETAIAKQLAEIGTQTKITWALMLVLIVAVIGSAIGIIMTGAGP